MLSFFRTDEVFKFADAVVAEYDRLQRSAALRHDTPLKRQQKFETLNQKIDQYTRTEKLNFYKKSRMLHAIKQGLAAKGIPDAEIEAFVSRLVMKGLVRE